jgi:hypothetical protein
MTDAIDNFITQAVAVQRNKRKAQQLCRNELKMLYSQYSDFTVHQKLTDYRNALRAANLETPFLTLMREPAKKMQANRTRQRQDVYERQGTQRPLHNPDTIIARAEEMLGRESYAAMGLGIALLTGRRDYEVFVSGSFSIDDELPHWMVFSGQAKTRNAEKSRQWFRIPVLTDPQKIVDAIIRLRAIKDFSMFAPVENMPEGRRGSYTPSQAFQNRVGKTLRETCTRYFDQLIPSCVPHDLRKAYAVIAYDQFAPVDMSQSRFISEILGHDENDLGTAQSYQDFYLAEGDPVQ